MEFPEENPTVLKWFYAAVVTAIAVYFVTTTIDYHIKQRTIESCLRTNSVAECQKLINGM